MQRTNTRTCIQCGGVIPAWKRSHATLCSDRCRVDRNRETERELSRSRKKKPAAVRVVPEFILQALPLDSSYVSGIDLSEALVESPAACAQCGVAMPADRWLNPLVDHLCSDACRTERGKRDKKMYNFRRRWGIPVRCRVCGKVRPKSPGANGLCSDACRAKDRQRKAHWCFVANREKYYNTTNAWRRSDAAKEYRYREWTKRRASIARVRHVDWDRHEIAERDNHICYLCGETIPDGDLHVDHVRPLTMGGDDAPWNLAATHSSCNLSKGTTFPEVAQEMERRLTEEVTV